MNKESYSYYKKAYRANKRYRDKTHSDDYGPMLSKSDFEDMKNTGLSAISRGLPSGFAARRKPTRARIMTAR